MKRENVETSYFEIVRESYYGLPVNGTIVRRVVVVTSGRAGVYACVCVCRHNCGVNALCFSCYFGQGHLRELSEMSPFFSVLRREGCSAASLRTRENDARRSGIRETMNIRIKRIILDLVSPTSKIRV